MSTIRLWIAAGVLCVSSVAAASPKGKIGVSGMGDGPICLECHTGGKTPNVTLAGPAQLALGERGSYSLTIRGGPGVVGGYDIAVDHAGAQLVGKDERTRRERGELTHAGPVEFADGALTVAFELVAPSEGSTLTLFAAGNSCNGDDEKTGDGASATRLTVMLTGDGTGGGGGSGGEGGGGGDPGKVPPRMSSGCSVGAPAGAGGAGGAAVLLVIGCGLGLGLRQGHGHRRAGAGRRGGAVVGRAVRWAGLGALSLVGCNGAGLPATGMEKPSLAAGNVCQGDKEWSVSVRGSGLERFEGRALWVSAVEPKQDGNDEVAVFLQGRVVNGAVELACDRGLSTNYWYPSLSLAIDANGDGRCSDGDVQMTDQFYGWNDDQKYVVSSGGATAGARGEQQWAPIGAETRVWRGASICSYYFPAATD